MILAWIRAFERLLSFIIYFLTYHLARFDAGLKAFHVLPYIKKYNQIYTDIDLLKEYIPTEKQTSLQDAEFIISHNYTTKPGIYFSQEGNWSNLLIRKYSFKSFEPLIYLILFVYLLLIISGKFIPIDDLNRHLKAWQYANYKELYPFTKWMFSFNPYWLWDYFFGVIYDIFGFDSFKVVQVLMLLLFFVLFKKANRDISRSEWPLLLILWFFFLNFLFLQARPAVFLSFVSLIIYLGGGLFWKLLWTVMSIGYYAWFIYVPLLIHKRHMLLLSILVFSSWQFFTQGQYLPQLTVFFNYVWERGINTISENMFWLFHINVWIFLLLLLWVLSFRYVWGIFYGMVLYQIRYFIQITLPLLLASVKPRLKWLFSWVYYEIFYVFIIMGLIAYTIPSSSSYDFGNISLDNKTILASNMKIMYQIIYHFNNIKIAPAMEYGLNIEEVNMFMKGNINCSFMKNFDYIISEKVLNASCLSLNYTTSDLFFYIYK